MRCEFSLLFSPTVIIPEKKAIFRNSQRTLSRSLRHIVCIENIICIAEPLERVIEVWYNRFQCNCSRFIIMSTIAQSCKTQAHTWCCCSRSIRSETLSQYYRLSSPPDDDVHLSTNENESGGSMNKKDKNEEFLTQIEWEVDAEQFGAKSWEFLR